ncbi:dihydroxy-acid dehydratase-like protein [Stemphylium lycopersici]|uniref:dihydroxy-acid dehydratase n=1 Tax=Stemphylium lycopersici TaxID=183478 RepID=A0A364N9Y4_STELY|nr:dihydroxy-acid dehydratase [Stemphylium lycopersici]RAR09304.1 dihydroxy-acid dehydratase-like protein [Stemphylium lycopersici]RAR13997.1 dihydroxy-acid dehydratase-like protein [Stemphylium lycopersici]
MDPQNLQKQREPEEPRFLSFPHLPEDAKHEDGTPALNKYSSTLTAGHNFPGAQAMLYAAGVPSREAMKKQPHVGICSVWWEGNPCNTHLLDLGKEIKKHVQNDDMLAWQYNTVGVSDGITMGGEGKTDCIQLTETIPGCDKNMPGVIMAFARHNRPSLMVYGGSIMPGYSETLKKPINISTCYESHGAYIYKNLKSATEGEFSPDEIMEDIEKNACPGAGACGGMYTANTMSTSIEAMGLSLPNSSTTPATSPAKMRECAKAAAAIRVCMEKNITPRKLLTKASFENALVMMMVLGGSTNAVLHLLAMAGTAGVPLTLDDFQRVSNKIPFLADLAPSGRYMAADLFDIGGMPSVMKLLVAAGLLDGSIPTVTGKTLAENIEGYPSLPQDQTLIRPLNNPIKPTGHIEILRGNLAPSGAVAKITGKEGLKFTGKAIVFDKEHQLDRALNQGQIPHGENVVVVVRYEGPKGGPGMPEQLKASAAIMGAKLTNVALITDGRYSGASHGFIVGHICPEAAVGGPIAIVRNGDTITIDAEKNRIDMDLSDEEIEKRLKEWVAPSMPVTRGVLAKYARLVGDASHGAMTDLF